MKKLSKDHARALAALIDALNDAEEAGLFGVADEAREFYDERSERWQEGERGAAYETWVEALEEALSEAQDIADLASALLAVTNAPEYY